MPAPEAELLTRARQGDDEALMTLLAGASEELRRSLAGKIPARWNALLSEEDVLQQTYTDAFVGIARFVPVGDGAFVAWLKTMARNNLRDALRGLKAEKRGGGRAPITTGANGSSAHALYENLLAESTASPSRTAARGEAVRALEAAVERLPENYARVVRLYDLEGKPIDEVASAFEKSPGAVYLLRNRAHARLRELLGGGEGFLGSSP